MHIHRISKPRLSRMSACERLPRVLSPPAAPAGGAEALVASGTAGHSGALAGWRSVGDMTASPAKTSVVCRVQGLQGLEGRVHGNHYTHSMHILHAIYKRRETNYHYIHSMHMHT